DLILCRSVLMVRGLAVPSKFIEIVVQGLEEIEIPPEKLEVVAWLCNVLYVVVRPNASGLPFHEVEFGFNPCLEGKPPLLLHSLQEPVEYRTGPVRPRLSLGVQVRRKPDCVTVPGAHRHWAEAGT